MRKVNVSSTEVRYPADHPEGLRSGVYRLAKDVGAERTGASGSGQSIRFPSWFCSTAAAMIRPGPIP